MVNDCIFCKIAAKELPSSEIWENENFYSFLDINPVSEGHSLVIPKAHYETIFDIPKDELSELIKLVKKISMGVKEGVNADGINIVQNNFRAANQLVPHIHFHIIPRHKNDGITFSWEQHPYPPDKIKEVQLKIKSRWEK